MGLGAEYGGEFLRVGLLSTWASRLGGGVYEAMRQHALGLARDGRVEVRVFALDDPSFARDRAAWGSVEVTTRPQFGPRSFGYSPGLLEALLQAKLDCLHLHGIWMFPSIAGARWAAQTGRPYLVSPHGMLEPWILSRGRLKKAVARRAYEEKGWRAASLFHALTGAEARDIRASLAPLGLTTPITTLPNGVAVPLGRGVPRPTPPNVLYLGRIHPKKNIGALLDAWRAQGCGRTARLTIAGWGDPADVAALEARLAADNDPSVAFVGPAFGDAKSSLLKAARFLVLPSFSEGLPMTVLEAWAHGTPSLMTAACNLPEGFSAGAALEISPDAAELGPVLARALALDDDSWDRMSRAAHGLVRSGFDADSVTARWVETYAGLVGRTLTTPPDRLRA